MRIRRELGTVLPLDRLADAPRYVAELLRDAETFRKRSVALREEWAFNFGRSVEVGAREIARLADEQRGPRARRGRAAMSLAAAAAPLGAAGSPSANAALARPSSACATSGSTCGSRPTVAWVYAPLAYVGHMPRSPTCRSSCWWSRDPAGPAAAGGAAARRGPGQRGGRLPAARQPGLRGEPLPPRRPDVHPAGAADVGASSGSTSSLGLAIEGMLARWVWQRTATAPARRVGRYLALGLGAVLRGRPPHPRVGRGPLRRAGDRVHPLPPALLPAAATRRLQARLGLVDRGAGARARASSPRSAGRPAGELHYPLAPLPCAPPRPMLNVLSS